MAAVDIPVSVFVDWISMLTVVGPCIVEFERDGIFSSRRRGGHVPGNLSEGAVGLRPGPWLGSESCVSASRRTAVSLMSVPSVQHDMVAIFPTIAPPTRMESSGSMEKVAPSSDSPRRA